MAAGSFERAGLPSRIFSARYILARPSACVVEGYHIRCQKTVEFPSQETPVLGVSESPRKSLEKAGSDSVAPPAGAHWGQ